MFIHPPSPRCGLCHQKAGFITSTWGGGGCPKWGERDRDPMRTDSENVRKPFLSLRTQHMDSKSTPRAVFSLSFFSTRTHPSKKQHRLVCEVNYPWGKNSRDKSWLPLLRSTWARLSSLASLYFHEQIRKQDARLFPWSVVPCRWPG